MLPAIHSSAHHIVEPGDHPISQRHLRITYSSMKHSDKTFMGMIIAQERRRCDGHVRHFVRRRLFGNPSRLHRNCNGNSPLVWDETMLGAMRAFAKRNQPVLCSPFVLGGANTPASVAPTVAQLNAEALSALAYTQVIRKGTPAIYGHYLATVNMQSGAPMAGTPEISLMNFMIGQMARYYDVPWRTSNTLGGSKVFDAQAGYECDHDDGRFDGWSKLHLALCWLERSRHALFHGKVRRRRRTMRHGLSHGRGRPLGRL